MVPTRSGPSPAQPGGVTLRHGLLLLIVVLAALTRLWHLGTLPAGFTADEASMGYNAFTLLHTGRACPVLS